MTELVRRVAPCICALTVAFVALLPAASAQPAVADPAAESINPGINARFLDPDLDVDAWAQRFEGESREVFAARGQILAALELRPGMLVADIGAGTGAYTSLFAEAVGAEGAVFAVEISMPFLKHIAEKSAEAGHEQVTPVLCTDSSCRLPPESIELAFICDVYHHFEHPSQTLASIHRALRPGGELVVIDFERIPGVSRDWTLEHVRAGKETFRSEIEAAGLEFVEEVDITRLEENYMLRFRKPETN